MQILKTYFFILIAFSLTNAICAQSKPKTKPATSTQKFKAPKLQTYLSEYKDSVSVPASVAENIIAMQLKIYDDKKNEYAVSSYQFLYKRKVVTEDEKTGKVSGASSIASDRFKESPLPQLWINLIRQGVKSGEELYFFDVIAKDAQGRVMYAPDLKIMVK